MIRIIKRLISIVLCFLLSFGLSHNIFVAVAADTPIISSPNVSVISGETFSIPFSISNNSGFMGFSIIIEYDDAALNPVSVTSSDLLNSGSLNDSIGGTLPSGILKIVYTGNENILDNGILFTVNFETKESADGCYTLKTSYIQGDTFDENYDDVFFNCINPIVSVTPCNSDIGLLSFYSESYATDAGMEIIIPVYAKNAKNLSKFRAELIFDNSVFVFKRILTNHAYEIICNEDGYVFIDFTSLSDISDNNIIFEIVFDVIDYIETEEEVRFTFTNIFADGAFQESMSITSKITINNTHKNEPSIIYSEETLQIVDNFVDMPVFINNNHGIMGFMFNFSYDSEILEAVNVTHSSIISNGSFDHNIGIMPDSFKVVWNSSADMYENGKLFVIRFKIISEETPSNLPVTVTYSQENTFDESWDDVVLDINIKNVPIKSSYTATFVANGEVVAVVEFTDGTEKLDEPDVPQKPGCIARWSPYELKNEDIVIYAEYFSPEAAMTIKHTLRVDESVKLLPVCNFKTLRRNWTSSNPDIATVDDEGKVTAISEGECEISVTCYGEDYFGNEIKATASADIKIRPQTYVSSFKELIREIFDNFFKVKLHDLVDNLLHLLTILFRYAW